MRIRRTSVPHSPGGGSSDPPPGAFPLRPRRRPLSAGAYLPSLGALILVVLAVDSSASAAVQWLLAGAVWTALAVTARGLAPEDRATVVTVVLVATCGELFLSEVWRVYQYRLGSVPPYVPPGHGLVYAAGITLAQSQSAVRWERWIRAGALLGLAAWVSVGLTVLQRVDVAGALCAVVLGVAIAAGGSRALLFCGIFGAVALLEIHGTAMGAWTWSATVPGTSMPSGNPPSGAAAIYVVCDVTAVVVGRWLPSGSRAATWRPPHAIFR